MNCHINNKVFKTEKDRADDVFRYLKKYWKDKKERAFKKDELVQYLEEQLDESRVFIKECIRQLRQEGYLYAPDHVLKFSKELKNFTD